MNKPKIYAFIASLLIVCMLAMTACTYSISMSDSEIKSILDTEYKAVKSAVSKNSSYKKSTAYITKWAKDNKIKVTDKTDEYMVLSLSATKGHEFANTTVLQMPLDKNNIDIQCQLMAVMFATAKAAEDHGSVKLVFTRSDNMSFSGAKKLKTRYLDTGYFINFMYSSNLAIYNKGASASYNTITRKVNMTTSKYDQAYTFSISGLRGGYTDSAESVDRPNPTDILSSFLASAKSGGIQYELASFSGGTSAWTLPTEATVTIVVPEGKVEKLTTRFESSYEKFMENYSGSEPDARYTMTQVKRPDKVVSVSAKDDIINLLYILNDGITRDDEGHITSSANTGMISLSASRFKTVTAIKDIDKSTLSDMESELKTSCGLCNMKAVTKPHYDPWITHEKSFLVSTLSNIAVTDPQSTIIRNENMVFKSRKRSLDIVSIGTNADSGQRSVKVLSKFLAKIEKH